MVQLKFGLIAMAMLAFGSCSTIYYNFWETFGQEKRDLLKSSVSAAHDDQEDLSQQFKDTLTRIRTEYKFEGGDLEQTYVRLSADYEHAEAKAEAYKDRIDQVEEIALDLFDEWQVEAEQFTNSAYRRDSLQKLEATKGKFNQMLTAMRQVEKTLDPVLAKFRDQVLYLKHNLNAQALGAFKTEFKSIEKGINQLSREIEKSSREANQFINTLSDAPRV